MAIPEKIDNAPRLRFVEAARKYIYDNISAFSPQELEKMVRDDVIDPKRVPPELRTDFVRYKLGLRK